MFNWFRRNKENKENQTPAPVVENKSSETKTEETTTPIADQASLEWAKTAFANIQKQKQQLQETDTEEKASESDSETITEKIEPSTTETETVSTEDVVKEDSIEQNVPAWLQKSDRLEVLKETAIEEEQELDEDFLWSAQVLANQGRLPEDVSEDEFIWLKKLRQGLGKTRRNLINQLKSVVGQGPLNQEAVMEIEAMLLSADVGIEATDYIITTLQNKLKEEALPPEEAIAYLKEILQSVLDEPLKKLTKTEFDPEEGKLNIWLLTGVNGVGKTTTIGKLAHLAQTSGYKCVIAAADTFRAAAVEQVKVWGERTNTPVIANQGQNTDPAAVVFDGITASIAREANLLLVDTAGRLQNKKNLMEELSKIRRIIDKKAINAHVESLLVLDATLGQNGLRQAQVFSEAAQLTGVVLTKLDGTAKGGVALAVCQQLNLPIRFIGAGEGIEDLRPFSSYEFVEALLSA
ncbi:signal recognition particle-docking protein FtsY [Geminocystis sp. CENA526]|uniref:signal recognition particle-docking protein FtsY n=1 Tax=Geminocystis sp. CENA526 TaxID=1355871 RepID=UPI003D6E468A